MSGETNVTHFPTTKTLVKFTLLLDACRVKFIHGCGPHLFINVSIVVLPRKKDNLYVSVSGPLTGS